LRGTRGLLLAGTAVVLTAAFGTPAASPVGADTIPQLEAERAQLLQQLADLAPARNAASQALTQAEAAYNQETAALDQAKSQLSALNSQLATLSAAIDQDQSQETQTKSALAALTRATYESAGDNTMMAAVLSAKDFTDAVNSLSGAASVSAQIQGLEQTLCHDEADLVAKQQSLQADFAQASALENQLADQANQLMVVVYARDQAVNALDGPARQIAGEIATIDDEIAADQAGQTSSGSGSGCNNGFAYGECTWYVATKRCIPWGGNADAWYYNAAKMGYAEGQTPEAGAVAVWWAGRGGASWVGHVAYVEAVGPSAGIPAGSFEISEMNWDGWDRVDYRVVADDPNVFQGFIYGPASG